MSGLRKREQAAIEAVARHFSATWETGGEESPDAYLTIAGKRIAVDVTAIKQKIAERGSLAKPRLRFDRVALGLVADLQAALRESIPIGQTVIVTVTAPIRLPSKTAAALEEKIRIKPAPKKFRGDRWLVVANEDGLSHIETYRHIYSQLSNPTDFKKILVVLAGGRVETLTE
jgi:hypothetical protein